jgi:invasion protein IalB
LAGGDGGSARIEFHLKLDTVSRPQKDAARVCTTKELCGPARFQWRVRDATLVAVLVTAILILTSGSNATTIIPDSALQLPIRLHLVLSSWTKVCRNGGERNAQKVCFTGAHGRTDSGTSFVAVDLIDSGEGTERILRVTVPLGMRLSDGTWIEVDQSSPIKTSYLTCITLGCIADYKASSAFLDMLKEGRELDILAVDGAGQVISGTRHGTRCRTTYPPPDFCEVAPAAAPRQGRARATVQRIDLFLHSSLQ